jgi:hypothetical protein
MKNKTKTQSVQTIFRLNPRYYKDGDGKRTFVSKEIVDSPKLSCGAVGLAVTLSSYPKEGVALNYLVKRYPDGRRSTINFMAELEANGFAKVVQVK